MDAAVRAEIDGHLIKADDKLRSARLLLQAGQHEDARRASNLPACHRFVP